MRCGRACIAVLLGVILLLVALQGVFTDGGISQILSIPAALGSLQRFVSWGFYNSSSLQGINDTASTDSTDYGSAESNDTSGAASVDEWSSSNTSSRAAVELSPAGIPLYPHSLSAYRHPSSSCRSKHALRNLSYSTKIMNETRVWEEIWPDKRESYPTEHERCHAVMVRMLGIVASVMKGMGLHAWFISHATLLGAVRHGGMIPWDVDIDIAMPRSHMTMLRRRWRHEFPRDMFLQTEKTEVTFHMWVGRERAMRIKDRYSTFHGMRFSLQRHGRRYRMKKWHLGAHVDVIPLEKKGRGQFKLLHHVLPFDLLFPLQTVCFEDMVLPAPHNISGFLTALYGPNYMTPPENASFRSPTTLPCLATTPSHGSLWSLLWGRDHPPRSPAVQYPRSDPYGSYADDFRVPYTLYYNSRG